MVIHYYAKFLLRFIILLLLTEVGWSFNHQGIPSRNGQVRSFVSSLRPRPYALHHAENKAKNEDAVFSVMDFDDEEEDLHNRITLKGRKGIDDECIVNFDENLLKPNQLNIDLHGLEQLAPLERQMLRMEGLEPYVLVSVMSSTTSYGTISGIHLWKDGVLDIVSALLLGTSMTGTICGVYSTVVFSMSILYGKTALGLDKEDAYYQFMEATSMQRIRGFKAFSYSLLLFVLDISLMGIDRLPDELQPIAAVGTVVMTVLMYSEFDSILEGAAPIFSDMNPGQEAKEPSTPLRLE